MARIRTEGFQVFKSWKGFVVMAIGVVIVLAIVFRVPAIKNAVTGSV